MKSKWVNEIDGFEQFVGYKVYEDGTVESYKKRHGHQYIIVDYPTRVLKPYTTTRGYLKVDISSKPKKSIVVHRLVALAFIPNPETKPQVNHIDGNKQNNNVYNLEWCTNQENHTHKCENGLNVALSGKEHYTYGRDRSIHHLNKKVEQYTIEGVYVDTYASTALASEVIGCHRTTITHALKTGKPAKGYIWKYT